VGSGAHKSCKISETVHDRTKVTITLDPSIMLQTVSYYTGGRYLAWWYR